MTTKIIGIVSIAFFLALACNLLNVDDTIPPNPYLTDGGEATVGDLCERARELDCGLARGSYGDDLTWDTPDDESCEEAASNAFGAGTWYDLDCMVLADTCSEMDTCGE